MSIAILAILLTAVPADSSAGLQARGFAREAGSGLDSSSPSASSDEERWLWRLIERLCPRAVHFPLIFLLAAALLESAAAAKGRPGPSELVVILLLMGAASAVTAAVLGWASASAGQITEEEAPAFHLRRWLGVLVPTTATVVTVLSVGIQRTRSRSLVLTYRSSLMLSAIAVALGSHLGGARLHAEDGQASKNAPESHTGQAKVSPEFVSPVDFHRDIEPILRESCVKCHGPCKKKAKLRLDTKEHALRGGQSGASIVPGSPEESPLYRALLEDAENRMPPKTGPLPQEKIELIRIWIAQGAPWPEPAEMRR